MSHSRDTLRWSLVAVVAALGLFLANGAAASVAHALTLAELVDAADVVAVVVATSSEVVGDSPAHLSRRVVARVETCVAGDCPQVVEIHLRGGARGGVAKVVPGEASLEVGQRGLVFLRRGEPLAPVQIVGLAQGLFRVSDRGGVTVVHRNLEGLSLVGESCDGGATLEVACAAQSFETRLSTFIARIQQLAGLSSRR